MKTLFPNPFAMKGLNRPVMAMGTRLNYGGPNSQSRSDAMASMGAYGDVSDIFAIVNRIGEAVGMVDWSLYSQSAKSKDRTLVDDATPPTSHPFTTLWAQPNPWFSRMDLLQTLMQHLDLTGNAYWVKARTSPNAPPVELWPIRPDQMMPVPDPDDFIVGYVQRVGSQQIPWPIQDVIHFRIPDPTNPYRGKGVVQALMTDVESERFASQWNRNFFANDASPGGIIMSPKELSDVEFDKLVTRWREQHQGTGNAARWAILEGGLTAEGWKISQKDMQYEGLRKFNTAKFLFALGMHGAIMGISEHVNRANALAADQAFVRWVLTPRLERIKHAINQRLVPEFGDNLTADYQDPAPQDSAELTTEGVYLWQGGLATLGQACERAGLPAPDDQALAGQYIWQMPQQVTPALPPGMPTPPKPAAGFTGARMKLPWPTTVLDVESQMQPAWEARLAKFRDEVVAAVEARL